MEESLFISICIPAYRRTDFLKRLLDSIWIQTYLDYEVVLTDDSPGTEVQELADRHPLKSKIRYFKNAVTLGTPENWNESVRRASYEWIKIMHDDDWFSGPESLKEFAAVVRDGRNCFYFSSFINTYPDGKTKTIHISSHQLRGLKNKPEILLAANRIGPPSAVIFKKDPSIVFDNRMQWLVDIDFYIGYLNRHPHAIHIPKNLVCIGISDTQVTRASFGNRKIEIPERFALFEKINPNALRNITVYDSWWRFVRNMQIRDTSEISANGYKGMVPVPIQSMIVHQSYIAPSLLRVGFFSKLLMFIHFLRTFNAK